MKSILLSFLILLSLSEARASDTLTLRQIYNFNVGDTFDYVSTGSVSIPSYVIHPSFTRYIIQSKTISIAGDSITYIRQHTYPALSYDTLVYTFLDSNVIMIDTLPSTGGCPIGFTIDTSWGGILYNQVSGGCDGYNNHRYQEGLGISWSNNGGGSSYDPPIFSNTQSLIYYSKNGVSTGTPYYIANGQALIHFTPIPEQCATWTRQVGHNSPLWGSYYEQIRTDSIIPFNSHNYVSLLFRSADSYYNTFTTDSLIGYFRNDTLGRKVWFTPTHGSPETILYNFNLMDDSTIGGDYVTLSRTTIAGQSKTVWSYSDVVYNNNPNAFPYSQIINRGYAEGIGGLQGFVKVKDILHSDTLFYAGAVLATNVLYDEGNLVSFCVCGNTVYPDTPLMSCRLLTGINNIPSSQIHLYPNPTSDEIHLSVSEMNGANYQIILTDILGNKIYTSLVTQSESTHNISNLSPGMYTWRLMGNNTLIKSGKIVKD